MTPLLTVDGVTAYYGNIIALRGVDLVVNEGEIVTLIGANGAGKSTLMMTICGSPQAREGSIRYAGADITRRPTHDIMRMAIAHAPEGRRVARPADDRLLRKRSGVLARSRAAPAADPNPLPFCAPAAACIFPC